MSLEAVATALDIFSWSLSLTGIFLETLGLAGGLGPGIGLEFSEPTPGGGTAAGIIGGLSLAVLLYSPLNAVENRLGTLSLALVALADVIEGSTCFQRAEPFPGVTSTELAIGQDTVVVWSLTSLGYSPEAISDFLINSTAVIYDIGRLSGRIQTNFYGAIGVTDTGIWYLHVAPMGK